MNILAAEIETPYAMDVHSTEDTLAIDLCAPLPSGYTEH